MLFWRFEFKSSPHEAMSKHELFLDAQLCLPEAEQSGMPFAVRM
jgi:hypothetical protein